MIYDAYQSHADALDPFTTIAGAIGPAFRGEHGGLRSWHPLRRLAAACEVFGLARLRHQRPAFGIGSVTIGRRAVAVREEVVTTTPFGTLLRFRKDLRASQPRVLLVAPMSGHFATLLRETVRTMLADHDVYVTDWHNARDVPLEAGRFGMDEYVEHIVGFLAAIGPGAHLMAICQPCVEALAAVAVMAETAHPALPRSLVLMAGPIDCRINPTRVNELATSRSLEWFEQNLIATVPARHAGSARRVYPGFLQLAAFISMNLERHLTAFRELYEHLVNGEIERAQAARRFYEEYFSVADLPAEFYLETVRLVFQEHALARGRLPFRGRTVDPRAIRRTALLTVEGERNDICSLGQTLAAHDICGALPQYLRTHYIQAGAGHYGVFSGKRWSAQIYPVVREVIHASDQ